jgi:hypothetical protein
LRLAGFLVEARAISSTGSFTDSTLLPEISASRCSSPVAPIFREGHRELGDNRNVVVADQRKIVGNAQPEITGHTEYADRDGVAHRENGVRARVPAEQCGRRIDTPLNFELGRHYSVRRQFQTGFGQGIAETRDAFPRRAGVIRPRDHSEIAIAAVQ